MSPAPFSLKPWCLARMIQSCSSMKSFAMMPPSRSIKTQLPSPGSGKKLTECLRRYTRRDARPQNSRAGKSRELDFHREEYRVKDIRLAFSRSEAAALMIESGATCACSLMRPERFDNEGGILGNICQRMRVWLLGDDSVPLTLSLASQPPRPSPGWDAFIYASFKRCRGRR